MRRRKRQMAFEQLPNRGSLFTNHKKKDQADPDMTGRALVETPSGRPLGFDVEGFLSKTDEGDDFIKLTFTAAAAGVTFTAARGERRKVTTGALFPNQFKKSDKDKSPDMRGNAVFDLGNGQQLRVELAAWISESDDRLSLQFRPKNGPSLRELFG